MAEIPLKLIDMINSETDGLTHGSVNISIHIRDGRIARYIINREQSILASDIQGSSHGK